MPVGLTRTEYARHRKKHGLQGHTTKSIRQAIDRGACPTLPDGSIDPLAADKAWRAWHVAEVSGEREADEPAVGGPDYNTERALHEAAKRELAELKLAQARGDSVDAEAAAAFWYEQTSTARDLLLGIPDRVSDQLATMTDPHAVRTVLMREITDALASLSEMPMVGDEGEDEAPTE